MKINSDRLGSRSRSDEGTALVALFVIVVVCGALAISVLIPNIGRHREAKAAVEHERAFHLAEAGIDFGIAEIRKSFGVLPVLRTTTGAPGGGTVGSYSLTFTAGDANGRDDDGDGFADDTDEEELVQLVSTGTYGDAERTVRVMLRRAVASPEIVASIQFNVATPILDLNGNRFHVSGFDHDLTGAVDPALAPMHGMAAPADPATLSSQLRGMMVNQIVGAGGNPSIRQVDAIDLDRIVEQSLLAKTHDLAPGTHSNFVLGAPDPAGIVVAVCDGNLRLSGTAEGYGVLVVNGDLVCAGELLWTGIVIVRGRATMVGGGSRKRMIGALIVGEEVADANSAGLRLTGTVNLDYSSQAIALSQSRLTMMTVLSWQEVANP